MNLFENQKIYSLQRNILKLLRINIVLVIILAFAFYIYSNSIYALSLLPLIIIIGFLISKKNLICSELGLIYILYTVLYIIIPALCIILLDQDYIFGTSISSYPGDSSAYLQDLNSSTYFLLILWVSMYFGLILGSKKNKKFYVKRFSLNIKRLKFLGIVVIIFQLIDVINIYEVRNGGFYSINYLTQILNDHAYLLIVTLFLVYDHSINANEKIKFLNIVFIAFLILYTISGGKAGLLVITFLLLVYQFSLAKFLNKENVIFYNINYVLIILILLPLLFIIGKIFRIFLQLDFNFNKITIEYVSEELADSILSIIYRLIQGGFDQFLAISNNFLLVDYDYNFNIIFITYLVKNTVNLLLPGTIYPEAFTMTSQLFPDVLYKRDLISTNTIETLILKLNTQPYSIFGFFSIIFGKLSPFFLFLFSYIYSRIFYYINPPVLKIVMIYFFGAFLSCFGLDVVIGNSFLILIGMYTMLTFVKK